MIERNWILDRIKLSSDHTALIEISTNERWTYADLGQHIQKWHAYFKETGLEKGDRIAVLSPNTIELIAIIFACGLSGVIYMPLNARLSVAEMNYMLADSAANRLLYHPTYLGVVGKLNIDTVFNFKKLTLTQKANDMQASQSEDSWLMIYTGGTTGRPKGVMLSHEAVNFNAMNTIISWDLSESDLTVNYMPFFHTGGINALCMPLLMAGGTVVMGEKFEPDLALKAIDDYQASICLFVPTMYQAMQEEAYFEKSDFPSMRVFLSGGAPCPFKIYDKFAARGLAFNEGYGLTEAGPNNFFIRPSVAKEKPGSVGKSMLFNQVKVVGEDGKPCQANQVGELWLKGGHLFTDYWQKPQMREAAFSDDWFKTGDLAKFDADGDYYIVGRKKEMIITGGENVYPQEVEHIILQKPGIREVAVVGIKDEKWGEKVVATITTYDGKMFNDDDIRAYCLQRLAKYKVPKHFILVDTLPKTDVGKIDKKQVRKLVENLE